MIVVNKLRKLRQGQTVVAVDPRYFRPTEVDTLLGDPSKARKNWAGSKKFLLIRWFGK